jgi:hypothetical protein
MVARGQIGRLLGVQAPAGVLAWIDVIDAAARLRWGVRDLEQRR